MSSDYTSIPSTGKLKLKGVSSPSGISKPKKKKAKKLSTTTSHTTNTTSTSKTGDEDDEEEFQDNSVILRTLEDEDQQIQNAQSTSNTSTTAAAAADDRQRLTDQVHDEGNGDVDLTKHLKTESERRHQEQRRKRLLDRLQKSGVKTHKQRVEELNKYLSGLSEHHDMPKIGPG